MRKLHQLKITAERAPDGVRLYLTLPTGEAMLADITAEQSADLMRGLLEVTPRPEAAKAWE